jgi:uncharacterized membrane protein
MEVALAKFPTESERSVTARVPMPRAYEYFWDVVGSSPCIPGLDSCKRVGQDTYRFIYKERSTGPVSLVVRYTAKYQGNGVDQITYEGTAAKGDTTEVTGVIRFRPQGADATRITLRQMTAPDTPIPWLLQALVRSFVEREAAAAVEHYLANAKKALEKESKSER